MGTCSRRNKYLSYRITRQDGQFLMQVGSSRPLDSFLGHCVSGAINVQTKQINQNQWVLLVYMHYQHQKNQEKSKKSLVSTQHQCQIIAVSIVFVFYEFCLYINGSTSACYQGANYLAYRISPFLDFPFFFLLISLLLSLNIEITIN